MKRFIVRTTDVTRMKELEAQGKSRKQIADELNLHPSSVTRHLGAVRQYRGLRLPKAA